MFKWLHIAISKKHIVYSFIGFGGYAVYSATPIANVKNPKRSHGLNPHMVCIDQYWMCSNFTGRLSDHSA